MDHKEELLQWILELEEYAKNQRLSMRILDNIEDCKQHISREDLPWQALRLQIEEVVESVESKVQPADEAVQKQRENQVPVEKVQARVRQMAEDCHRENTASAAAIEQRKNITIKESIRRMNEISHTEAHLEEMLDSNRYVDYFQGIKHSYHRDMAKTAGEMIADISGNYDHMADHMKSMFQSMGGYTDGMGNEKFYRGYESRKDDMEKRLTGEAQTVDYGSSVIMEFADGTKESIQKTVRKAQSKKRLFIWLPILIVLVLALSVTIIKYQKSASGVSVEQSGEKDERSVMDYVPKNTVQVYSLIGLMYFAIALIGSALSHIVAFVLIFAVLYAFYLNLLKKWCNSRICKRCGAYLRTELAAFEQEGKLAQTADQALSQIVPDCEQQYLAILDRLFVGTKYEEKGTDEVPGFETLQAKWNKLKYN